MILRLAHQPNHSQQNRFLIQNMATQEPNKASESKSKMFHQMTDTKTECFNHDPSAHESNKDKTHCEYPDSGWIFFVFSKSSVSFPNSSELQILGGRVQYPDSKNKIHFPDIFSRKGFSLFIKTNN